MKSTFVALFVGVIALAPLSQARAEEGAGSGKDHFERGMVFYNIQDWPSAIREIRAAYTTDPKPDYLYALAQAQRLSGDCPGAILSYRAFLRVGTGKATAAAEGFTHVCEAQEKQQEEAKAAALAAPVAATPAPPVVATATAAPPLPPPAPAPNHTWYADPLGDSLAVAGLAGAVLGAVFFAQASSASTAATSGAQEGSWQSNANSAKTDSVVGAVSFAGGGVLLAGAILRYVSVSSRGHERPPAPAVGLSVGHGGLQLSYGASF